MKWLSYKRVRISSLRLPGALAARKKQPHVIALAADIAELGAEPIHAPTFDKAGTLITGRDRMAALLLNKVKTCWIRVVEADARERAALEASENLFRRVDNRNELIAARVQALAEDLAAKRSGTSVPVAVTRKDTSAARERVAQQTGVTPAAVRKSEQRAAKDIPSAEPGTQPRHPAGSVTEAARGGEAATIPTPSQRLGCPIDTHGIATSPEFDAQAKAIIDALETADTHCRQAQVCLAPLKELPFPPALYQRLIFDAKALGAQLRLNKPRTVCLYCRDPDGLALLRDNCNGCGGRGWLSEEQWSSIPRELFMANAKPATKPVERKAALNITDADGNPIVVTKLDPESLPLPIGEAAGDDYLEPVDDTVAE